MVLAVLWAGAYVLVAASMIVFAFTYWHSRAVRGTEYLLLASVLAAGQTLLYVGLLVVPSVPFKVLVWKGSRVMGTMVLFLWVVFTITWTGRERLARWWSLVVLAFPLAVFDILLLSNRSPWFDGFHSLYWDRVVLASSVGFLTPVSFEFSLVNLLHDAYAVLLLLGTLWVLVGFAMRPEQRLYRTRNALITLAPVGGLVLAVLFVVFSVPFEPRPMASLVANAFVAFAVLRFGIFDVVSLPEDSLLEAIEGGVLVYGNDGRVIDMNDVAKSVIDVTDDAIGRGIVATVEIATTLPNLRTDGAGPRAEGKSLHDPSAVGDLLDGHEFTTTVDGESRTFLVRVSKLSDASNTQLGWTVLFYDVTELRQKQHELDLLKQVLSRVLRHNVRNELTVIKANAQMLSDQASGLNNERLQTIIDKSDNLLSASEKARTVERLLEGERDRGEIDLVETVEDYISDEATVNYPDAEFETSLPQSLTVTVHWALPVAIENIVENAVEHNDQDQPRVEITAERRENTALLTVRDNGPGISQSELDVLERRRETQLDHGSGVGLWLVDWIIDLSQGELYFDHNDPRGTIVTIQLPAADT